MLNDQPVAILGIRRGEHRLDLRDRHLQAPELADHLGERVKRDLVLDFPSGGRRNVRGVAVPAATTTTKQEVPVSNTGSISGLEGVPDVIRRYFVLDADRDIELIVALFSDDATVVDEGETRHGTMAIRAWQAGPASRYTYTTDVLGTDALSADRLVVTGRLTGNFPGGTVVLKWDFTVAGDRVSQLVIAP